MNIRDYISTGILEAYVLGELSDYERTELENNLRLYPELREELLKVEEANEKLLLAAGIAPSAAIKERLFSTIETSADKGKVIPLSDKNVSPIWRYAAAASIIVALGTSYLAYTYHQKWRATSGQLTALIAQNMQTASRYNQVEFELNKLQKDVEILQDPSVQKVLMKGTPNAPTALASVYWNQSTSEVHLRIHEMKQLSKEQQYQLWAIIDGKPVDAGVFDSNVSGLVKMKDVKNQAVMFAVTIEPRGGKKSPTLETMQVVGNVVKG